MVLDLLSHVHQQHQQHQQNESFLFKSAAYKLRANYLMYVLPTIFDSSRRRSAAKKLIEEIVTRPFILLPMDYLSPKYLASRLSKAGRVPSKISTIF